MVMRRCSRCFPVVKIVLPGGLCSSPAFTSRLRGENAPVIAVREAWSRMSQRATMVRWAAIGALVATAALAAPPLAGAAPIHAAARPSPDAPGKPAKSGNPQAKPPGPARPEQSAQGVVQAVLAGAVVLKELDGSTVRVPVGPRTRVFVDGKRALLSDVEGGFVVIASWNDRRPTSELQALSPRGAAGLTVVQSVLPNGIVVQAPGGPTVTIRVNARTRLFVDGQPSTLRAVGPGFTLITRANQSKGARPARELRFLSLNPP
jgi:hypothetical protein